MLGRDRVRRANGHVRRQRPWSHNYQTRASQMRCEMHARMSWMCVHWRCGTGMSLSPSQKSKFRRVLSHTKLLTLMTRPFITAPLGPFWANTFSKCSDLCKQHPRQFRASRTRNEMPCFWLRVTTTHTTQHSILKFYWAAIQKVCQDFSEPGLWTEILFGMLRDGGIKVIWGRSLITPGEVGLIRHFP